MALCDPVVDPAAFLAEFGRIARPGGVRIINGGRQPGKETKEKILRSATRAIEEETDAYLRCRWVR